MAESEGIARIRKLDPEEIAAVLRRNHVGRIGYTRRGKLDIQPVLYVYEEGWIYGRTSYGTKYETIARTAYQWWPVVFEVDEVDDLFRWRSVLVRGGFYVLSRDAGEEERERWARGLELVRRLDPAALGKDDVVPFRTVLFRIAVQEASGRESALPQAGE
jgi:hypothetical protein